MKTMTTHTPTTINRRAKFFGTMLTLALFISAAAVSQTQLPVNLGSTANFVILGGSLISNVPTSKVTGNIGLSPAAGSNITGFGLTEITGLIYTVDATGPAGSTISAEILTAAKGDLTVAYNDAAGRTPVPTGPFLNPGSGNMGGLTLVPGLYKFTSDALITGSDLTLTGSATDVWIFQIASALNVGNGIHIVLAGGAQASNIFWQVGTSATLGTTSIFKGTIMADQSISLATGATLEGRALASISAVTIESSTITAPAIPAGSLTVVSTVPANNAVNVPLQTTVSVTFNSPLDTAIMKNLKYSVYSNIINGGLVSYGVDAKTFSATAQLEANTDYFISFFFAKGKDGTTLQSPYVYYFTTGNNFSSTTVSGSVVPGSTGVSPQNSIVGLSTTPISINGNPAIVAWANVNSNGTFTIPYAPKGTLYPFAAKDVNGDGEIKPELGVDVVAVGDSIKVDASVTGVILTFFGLTTSAEQIHPVLSGFSLAQNYPNPFNPTTMISYQLAAADHVSLKVYDAIGREAATLVNSRQEAGGHTVSFNANIGTSRLTSGVYFYRLVSGSFVSTKKLILMK